MADDAQDDEAHNVQDDDAHKARRREFLEKCGRFAVVTPPAVALMLTVSDKAYAVTSGATTTKTTTIIATTPVGSLLDEVPAARKNDVAMVINDLRVLKVL